MKKGFRFAAGMLGWKRLADKSVRINFETNELNTADAMVIDALQGSFGWLIFVPDGERIEDIEIPAEKAVEKDMRTPSQRLRAVLYLQWQELARVSPNMDFDTYYKATMENIINSQKKLLDNGDNRSTTRVF